MILRILIISLGLWVCQSGEGFGQAQADRYFEYEQFYKAAKLYDEALQADSTYLYAAYQLAECYRRLFAYQTAEKYYKMVYKSDTTSTYPLALFYYALMLKYNEQFRAAITHFDKYLVYPEQLKRDKIDNYRFYDAQAIVEKNGCYFALTQLSRRSKRYNFEKLPIPFNSEYNDYAPAIYLHDTMVVFTSGRLTSRNPIDNRFGESFGDIYQIEKTEEGWHNREKDEGFSIVNTKWADGSGTFNQEKNKYYYTSCDKKNETCRIYVTEYRNQRWQEPVLLNENVNAPQSNAKQPALTASGDTLFFVSDRSGGYGGNDIWMSISAGGDNWSPAINLGENINTSSNELSPFYYPDISVLFFASSGHEGFGGLDIYMVRNLKKGKINNLGWPFNSSRDDCYFVFGNNTGYLSSNRDDTETKFDIYSFAKHPQQTLLNYINEGFSEKDQYLITSTDKNTGLLNYDGLIEGNISGVNASISDLSLSYAMSYKNLRSGASRFILSANLGDAQVTHTPQGEEIIFSLENNEIISRKELLFAPENLSQTPIGVLATINTFGLIDTTEHAVVTGELYDVYTQAPIAEEIVQLANDQGDVIKITTTDKKGGFRFSNLNAQERYKIMLKETASDQYPAYYLTDVKVVSYGGDISVEKFENIYFDNNAYQLRNEAKIVLDELIDYFSENPEIQIEINAYTDSTGSDMYNIELSRKRGKMAFDYLLEQGVDRTAVVINAKGKEAPVAANNNPAGKQLNRRVEFEIIGPDIQYQPTTTTLVVKTEMSLSTLANHTGMSEKELQLLNNFSTTRIPAYTPVRVKLPVNQIDETLFAGIASNVAEDILGRE